MLMNKLKLINIVGVQRNYTNAFGKIFGISFGEIQDFKSFGLHHKQCEMQKFANSLAKIKRIIPDIRSKITFSNDGAIMASIKGFLHDSAYTEWCNNYQNSLLICRTDIHHVILSIMNSVYFDNYEPYYTKKFVFDQKSIESIAYQYSILTNIENYIQYKLYFDPTEQINFDYIKKSFGVDNLYSGLVETHCEYEISLDDQKNYVKIFIQCMNGYDTFQKYKKSMWFINWMEKYKF